MPFADIHLLLTHVSNLSISLVVTLIAISIVLFLLIRNNKKSKRFRLMGLGFVGLIIITQGGVLGIILLHVPPVRLQLQQVANILLPGGASRFDYESLDQQTGLLFIAHSGADMVTVYDTNSNRVVANVANVPDVHGVLAIPSLGRVYATAGKEAQVYAIDEQTKRITAKIPVGSGPDGLAYDPVEQKLFVSDEDGESDAVIDVRTEKQIGIIPLGGQAGNTQYDPVSHLIFVDVQTLNQLVSIDPVSDHILARYPLPGCNHDHSLNIDALQRLAFVACDENAMLLVVDMHTMKIISTQTVGDQPDVISLDKGWHLLYVASEKGVISVFDEHSHVVRKVDEGLVAPEAHSIAVNQKTHFIYLPLQDIKGNPILRVGILSSPAS